MKMKQNYVNIGFVLTALTLLPLADPAMAEKQVPFKGAEVGADTFVSFEFPFLTISNTGEGEATHLGHYTVTGMFVIDVLSGFVTGTLTMTAANGDTLVTTMTGQAPPPSIKDTVDYVTVTGGTGRFEGATGSWVVNSHFAFLFTGGPSGPNPYIAGLKGTISTPGSNKQ